MFTYVGRVGKLIGVDEFVLGIDQYHGTNYKQSYNRVMVDDQ